MSGISRTSCIWTEQVPTALRKKPSSRKANNQGWGWGDPLRWEALSAKGELRGGLKRDEAEQPQPRLLWQPNIIHRYNQRKPKAVPFPEIQLL